MMSQCKKFAPNIFHKTKCVNCFRQKEEHSAEALECNRVSRSIARSGYLFVAPDWDFSVPLNKTKRWQRRWFVLYDDGELNYSVDEHPETIPQGSVNMSKVLEVTGAEQVTGHQNSFALTSPDHVTFIKAASREDARAWVDLLSVFPRRHKRNATFPGGRASPSLLQLGRSASPQPTRLRHLSCTASNNSRSNFNTPPLKEDREMTSTSSKCGSLVLERYLRPNWVPEASETVAIQSQNRSEYISSGSPPTRDKLRGDDKNRAKIDWRNERLRDIATALTDRSPESSLVLPAESLLHLKKGWLWLKTNDDLVRHWVVLSGPTLNIYADQDEQLTPELIIELATVTNYKEVVTDTKFGFEIKHVGPTLTLNAITASIRSNWLQALKKAAPKLIVSEVITTPTTPRSVFSSDDEYRTASEGGRRGSEDWSEISQPSSPFGRSGLYKEHRTRMRTRLPRCPSRHSTLDSTSTDELDCVVKLPNHVEFHNALNKDSVEINNLQAQVLKSNEEIQRLEDEIRRMKKNHMETQMEGIELNAIVSTFKQTEHDLNERNSQAELKFIREQNHLKRRIYDTETLLKTYEEKYHLLSHDIQTKHHLTITLQGELNNLNERFIRIREENDRLFSRTQELESLSLNNRKIESLSELANFDFNFDIDNATANKLKKYCKDLKGRFEKSLLEIRAVKKELRNKETSCNQLELENFNLEHNFEVSKQAFQSENSLLVARMEHLTAKLANTEKQFRNRSRSDSKDKRRSLSLKGRESFSLNKEVEDKVNVLEAKIIAIEQGRTNLKSIKKERNSPIDDRSLRRLRRKSLDSATTSESMKLLMRLSSLESQVKNLNASTESLSISSDLPNPKSKINECLTCVQSIRSNLKRSPTVLVEKLQDLKQNLTELDKLYEVDVFKGTNLSMEEAQVIKSSSTSVVLQLQDLLTEKLQNLNNRKQKLKECNQLDSKSKLEILAEKFAYENVLIDRIQEALCSPISDMVVCKRLINKEVKETVYLMKMLRQKLNGNAVHAAVFSRTSADYLAKTLSKCLISAANGCKSIKNYIKINKDTLNYLQTEQTKLTQALESYKMIQLPKLAELLATETILNQLPLNKLNDETINAFKANAKDIINSELIQAEIHHILLRAAQIYQNNFESDHTYFFSFYATERAALELWSDSVNDYLYKELNKSVGELVEQYEISLVKLQQQNWRRHVESERNNRSSGCLLSDFADVIAHKAMIDARIAVFCQNDEDLESGCDLAAWLENDNYWDCLENQNVQISQRLEAEFSCMFNKSRIECKSLIAQGEIEELLCSITDVCDEITIFQNKETNWEEVYKKCKTLRNKLEDIFRILSEKPNNSFNFGAENKTIFFENCNLKQVENLRAAYRSALDVCREREIIENLQKQAELTLTAMREWHERNVKDIKEMHAQEMEMLQQEKEQALSEETQATLAALDAMRKAHEAEVQREMTKFKGDWTRKQRSEVLEISERLSVKCVEIGRLERELRQAKEKIFLLERNI